MACGALALIPNERSRVSNIDAIGLSSIVRILSGQTLASVLFPRNRTCSLLLSLYPCFN